MICRMLGADYKALAFADNSVSKQGGSLLGLPVLSLKNALELCPRTVILCVTDAERSMQMRLQLEAEGFDGELITAESLRVFDARAAALRMLAEQISAQGIEGDAAELGVYRGDFARLISEAFPDRTLHLFDTFEGFSASDLAAERGYSRAAEGDFSDTDTELVRNRLHEPGRAVFYKGLFPDTFAACRAERFAFVSVDADLYKPTAAALPLFWDRLSPGGVLLLHDVNSLQFRGVSEAVREFCNEKNILPMPICDLHGSVVLRKL